MNLTSNAFKEGEEIPKKHSCEGQDVSPQLQWDGVPAETKSIALICDDPDAPMGTWVHWVIYNIPPKSGGLPENVPKKKSIDDGTIQGENDFGRPGYGGPCPPPGVKHRYVFKLYALDTMLDKDAGNTKQQLEDSMEGHILAETKLKGWYKR